ncbi:MAG: N-acetyl-alpha-D-glucosaminyl L-malate synthase BshA, partial [Bacteroidota bacterium]
TDITLVGKDPSFEPVITFCLNQSDAVTAVSESLKKDTLEHFNTKTEVHVVPNFIQIIDEDEKQVQLIRQRYALDDEPVLCHISNFRKVKRVEDVLMVFNEVNKKIPSKLLLVGDGPERANLDVLCRQLNLCDRVIMIGKVRDTAHVLGISDLFLLPSETESFGLAALEAMAMSVPVISSNTGGIPEVNVHGKTGYLSNVGDVQDMAQNAIRLLESKELLGEFKINALNRAKDFSLEMVLPMYEKIYRDVLSK